MELTSALERDSIGTRQYHANAHRIGPEDMQPIVQKTCKRAAASSTVVRSLEWDALDNMRTSAFFRGSGQSPIGDCDCD